MQSKERLLWPAWIPGVFLMLCGGAFMVLDARVDRLSEPASFLLTIIDPFYFRIVVDNPDALISLGAIFALWGLWYRKWWERLPLHSSEEGSK